MARNEELQDKLCADIEAEFQDGATDATRRAVSENAKQLLMKRAGWS